MKYKITITKEQMQIMVQALDWYSRLHMKQFRIPLDDILMFEPHESWKKVDKEKWQQGLNLLSQAWGFPSSNVSHGIHSPEIHQSARDSFAMQSTLRHELWKDNPKRSNMTVDSSDSFTGVTEMPKIEIERI